MSHACAEDPLVEQPAKAGPPSPWPSPSGRWNDGLFAEPGWQTVLEEIFGATGTLLPRLLSGQMELAEK